MRTAMVHQQPPRQAVNDEVLESWTNAKGERAEQTPPGLRIVPGGSTAAHRAPTRTPQTEHSNVRAIEAELAQHGRGVIATVNTETGEVESVCMEVVPYFAKKDSRTVSRIVSRVIESANAETG